MEILWKVCCISCLLLISSVSFICAENVTTTLKPESTPPVSEEEKPQSDLDLETQDQVAILKQINRVNDDGSYTFGYEAADGSFKIETRDVNGNVKGMFGFINEKGELKRVSYSASNGTGFQSTGTLNVPPLSGTVLASDEEVSSSFPNVDQPTYDQIARPKPKTEDSSTKISLLEPTTPNYGTSPEIPSPKLPIYIYGSSTARNEIASSFRPVVIQHIPKVRPTPATSSTAPTESEEVFRKPLFSDLSPKRTSNGNFISFGTHEITSTTTETPPSEEDSKHSSVIQVIRPRTGPFKKVIVTKRPIVTTTPKTITTTEFQSKEYLQKLKENESDSELGNGVRRQLEATNNYATTTQTGLLTSGTEDNPDVYGGGHTTRPYPTNAYRTLFTQIPQHQRILQNSFIQNQNQYLAAAFGNPGIQQGVPQNPSQGRTFTGAIPPNAPVSQNTFTGYGPLPVPVPQPALNSRVPGQSGTQPHFVGHPIPPQTNPISSSNNQDQAYNQLYIPPGLIEYIVRMLLLAQQRQRQQTASPFQQAVIATLGPGNVPPELIDSRYQSPYYPAPVSYPNYSQVPTPYLVPMIPRPGFDTLSYYQAPAYVPPEPRYNYYPPMYSPLPYSRIQPRAQFEIDPVRQNEDFLLKMLLGYSKLHGAAPVPPHQNPRGVVEPSPTYSPGRDSTTSSTTPAPRLGPVRNVQILGQIHDETDPPNNYEKSTKSGE